MPEPMSEAELAEILRKIEKRAAIVAEDFFFLRLHVRRLLAEVRRLREERK